MFTVGVRPDAQGTVAAGIVGLAVGDALGVPVEFRSRRDLAADPVIGMRGEGAHRQPAGTWSDDTSLTLCLAESLCAGGVDYADQARRFVGWLDRAEWTPHGVVFDAGVATRSAIRRLAAGVDPLEAGGAAESQNGNGSLMRILPLAIYLAYARPQERTVAAMACSRLTHRHPRSQLACALFVETAAGLVRGAALVEALGEARETIALILRAEHPAEQPHFTRLLSGDLATLSAEEVSGSGYVIDCLVASLWAALNAASYREGVLAAVNLGDDADTTGAVTGGLLGVWRGLEAIPQEWHKQLARREEVLALCGRFAEACRRRWELDQ